MMVLEVDSIEEFENTEAEVRNNRNGPSVAHLTMQLCRETTNDAARDLEKACQKICTTQKVPNHIEDDIYHQGGIGDPATVTFSIAIKALDSVRKGPLFFNKNMPSFFIRRMKKHYEWARDPDKWLFEGTDSRLRRLEYNRQRIRRPQRTTTTRTRRRPPKYRGNPRIDKNRQQLDSPRNLRAHRYTRLDRLLSEHAAKRRHQTISSSNYYLALSMLP